MLCGLAALLLLPHLVELAARRQIFQPHSERESHICQRFLDFIWRLTAEILDLEHVLFGALDQFADIFDVGILQPVERTHRYRKSLDWPIQQLVDSRARFLPARFGSAAR